MLTLPAQACKAVDFFVMAVKGSHELINAHAGCSKLFGGDGSTTLHCGCEAIGNGVGDVTELIPSKANEGFSRSGGERRVWAFPSRLVGAYMEQRWHNFLHQWSGGVGDVLDR
jgi:hypothetical protein